MKIEADKIYRHKHNKELFLKLKPNAPITTVATFYEVDQDGNHMMIDRLWSFGKTKAIAIIKLENIVEG